MQALRNAVFNVKSLTAFPSQINKEYSAAGTYFRHLDRDQSGTLIGFPLVAPLEGAKLARRK